MTVISLSCFSQITYDKGYFINNENQKVDCFIKNHQWRSNPEKFEYKLTEGGEIKKETIKSVKEFGIDGMYQFVRRTVDMDKSTSVINNLTYFEEPRYEEEELFLRVLVRGEYTLYQYSKGGFKRYFFGKNDSDIKQLVFKMYREDGKIKENKEFHHQLWDHLKCPSIGRSTITKVRYIKDDLSNFFVTYNECKNIDFVDFSKEGKRDFFNLNVRPRYNYSSLMIKNATGNETIDINFDYQSGFSIGLEAEFIFPFNRNKWAFIIEPTYQTFNAETNFYVENSYEKNITAKVEYTSVEATLGIRHYMFLNENSKFFVNGSYGFDIYSKSNIEFPLNFTLRTFEIEAIGNLAIGGGYKFKDKYSAEFRYHVNRNALGDDTWNSELRTFSFILGYTLF